MGSRLTAGLRLALSMCLEEEGACCGLWAVGWAGAQVHWVGAVALGTELQGQERHDDLRGGQAWQGWRQVQPE